MDGSPLHPGNCILRKDATLGKARLNDIPDLVPIVPLNALNQTNASQAAATYPNFT
jgi:hypothetical protein